MDCIIHGIFQARILEYVVIPFSRGSSQPRDRNQVSRIVGGFFTSWATSISSGHYSCLSLWIVVYYKMVEWCSQEHLWICGKNVIFSVEQLRKNTRETPQTMSPTPWQLSTYGTWPTESLAVCLYNLTMQISSLGIMDRLEVGTSLKSKPVKLYFLEFSNLRF